MTKSVVIGQGYVGLPLALCAAAAGVRVVGVDNDADVVARLNRGLSHVDDVEDQHVRHGLESGFSASTDASCIAEADVVAVCVPTPLSPDGGPDLRSVEAAAASIGHHIQAGTLVVLESTTYPGATEEVFAPLVLGGRFELGVDVNIAFSPERIDPGNKTYGVKNTPKVVGGMTPACTRADKDFYCQFIDTVVEAKSAKEVEMSKLLENTFRHVNIALVNEMVRFSNDLDIDVWNAIECAATKPFGYMPFRPGPGVGGHCIPVDPSYLSHRVRARLGYAFRIVELAEEINSAAPLYVADRVWKALNDQKLPVNGAEVLLVGVTYKADIADFRESPARAVAELLASWGARISYHDPFVPSWAPGGDDGQGPLTSVSDVYRTAAESDVVVLLQAHAFYDLNRLAHSSTLMFDTRAVVEQSDPCTGCDTNGFRTTKPTPDTSSVSPSPPWDYLQVRFPLGQVCQVVPFDELLQLRMPRRVGLDTAWRYFAEAVAVLLQQIEGIEEEDASVDPPVVVLELDEVDRVGTQHPRSATEDREVMPFCVGLQQCHTPGLVLGAEVVHRVHGDLFKFAGAFPGVRKWHYRVRPGPFVDDQQGAWSRLVRQREPVHLASASQCVTRFSSAVSGRFKGMEHERVGRHRQQARRPLAEMSAHIQDDRRWMPQRNLLDSHLPVALQVVRHIQSHFVGDQPSHLGETRTPQRAFRESRKACEDGMAHG